MKHPVFAIIFITIFLWLAAISFLDWIGVQNYTLNFIVFVALIPVSLTIVSDMENEQPK